MDEIENYETYVMSGVIILEQIINANKATVQNESDEVTSDDKKKRSVSYTDLVLGGLNLGLKIDEIEDMGIGRLFDLIIARGNMQSKVNNSKNKIRIRKAVQSDFDRF